MSPVAEPFGPYLLERRIGSGGMADVYLARGPRGVCVVKRPHAHLCDSPDFVRMFLSEATVLAHLHHPGIAQILDLGAVGNSYYLAMEYVPGFDLMSISLEFEKAGELIPAAVCARIVADVAAALHYAHEAVDQTGRPLSIIHRDVSPHNILLSVGAEVKLIDFGVAKAATTRHRTSAGRVKGKYPYMAPEQVMGQAIDRRVDIYALGLVLYELLTNVRAIAGETEIEQIDNARSSRVRPIEHLRADVTDPMRLIVGSCLHPDPQGRYQTALHLHQDLEKYLLFERRPVGRDDLLRLLRRMPEAPEGDAAAAAPLRGAGSSFDDKATPAPARAAELGDPTLRALELAPGPSSAEGASAAVGLAPTLPSMARIEPAREDATLLERPPVARAMPPAAAPAPEPASPRAPSETLRAAIEGAPALVTDPTLRLRRSPGPIVASIALAALGIGLGLWLVLSGDAGTPADASGAEETGAPTEGAQPEAPPVPDAASSSGGGVAELAPVMAPGGAEVPTGDQAPRGPDDASVSDAPTEAEAEVEGSTTDVPDGADSGLATLVVDCSPRGTLSAKGLVPAPCPGRLRVPAGQHTLTLRSPAERFRTSVTVEVQAGETKSVSLRFGRGLLKLTVLPYAELRLNGIFVASVSSYQELPLYAGSYRLDAILKAPELPRPVRKSVEIVIREGETSEVRLEMLR